jgi:hypothetical protein
MRSHARKGGNTQRGPRASGCVVIWGVGREPRQREAGVAYRAGKSDTPLVNTSFSEQDAV